MGNRNKKNASPIKSGSPESQPYYLRSSPKKEAEEDPKLRSTMSRDPSSSRNGNVAAANENNSDEDNESISEDNSQSSTTGDEVLEETEQTTPPRTRENRAGHTFLQQLKNNMFVVICCVVVVVALLFYMIYPQSNTNKEVLCEISDSPADKIKDLSGSNEIPGQSSKFWKLIRSNVRNLHQRPACVVLSPHMSNKGSHNAVKFLSSRLECILTGHNKTLLISGNDFQGEGRRSQLDIRLSGWFDSGKRVAVIQDIDKLSLDTAKVFYKFCDDNDDPTYPGSFLILTINHNDDDNIQSKYWLEQQLRDHWSNNHDEITPILSRVGNSWIELTSTA